MNNFLSCQWDPENGEYISIEDENSVLKETRVTRELEFFQLITLSEIQAFTFVQLLRELL